MIILGIIVVGAIIFAAGCLVGRFIRAEVRGTNEKQKRIWNSKKTGEKMGRLVPWLCRH